MTPPQISLAISQTPSFIAEKTFIEKIPKHYVEQLINNNCLQDKWDMTNYSQKFASQNYINEKEQLRAYFNNYNKKIGGFIVKYNKAKHKWGRVFPSKSLGLTSFAKRTRNTLIKNLYYDFDLKNCQPEILRCICESNNINCNIITKYCNERESIIADIIKASGNKCSRDLVKSLIIRLSFYGGFDGWIKENGIEEFPEPLIVKHYREQVAIIAGELKKHNPELFKTCEKEKKAKGETNIMGSFLSTYLQDYELTIVENVVKHLCSETNICSSETPNHFIATYEFDGLKLLIERVNEYGGIDKVLEYINALNINLGFNILWEVKPIEKFYDIEFSDVIEKTAKEISAEIKEREKSELERVKQEKLDAMQEISYKKNTEARQAYIRYKIQFEKNNCKIVSKGTYLEKNDVKFFMRSKKQLIESYEHEVYYTFKDDDDKDVNLYFIHEWVKDPNIRKYNDVGVFPNKDKCPKGVFNLWIPFAMELIVGEYEPDTEGRDFILNHLKILCDKEEVTYEYFEKWIAQMIQHPEFKSTCPILIGEQGGGKGTFMELMKVLLGKEKVLITSQPDKHVWGNFNTLMANAYLVGFDEISKSMTTSAVEFIKSLITENTININDKGHSTYIIDSYHHYMMMTNKADGGITTEKGDRRKLMIRISDELVGNKPYFNKFYEYLKNTNTMRTVYDYFKNKEDVPEMLPPPPSTEYQDNLKLLSEDPILRWLKEFVSKSLNKKEEVLKPQLDSYSKETPSIFYLEGVDDDLCCNLSGKDAFKMFCRWRDENHENYDTTPLKLGVNLTNKRLKGISKGLHTNKSSGKQYNLSILGKTLGVGCLIDLKKVISDE